MSCSDASTNRGWLTRLARPRKRAVPHYPTDEDIGTIAAMPLEKIKSELARMGAKDIPVPTLSSLSGGRGVSTTYNAARGHKSTRGKRGLAFLFGAVQPAGRPHVWLRAVLVALAALASMPARAPQEGSTERTSRAAASAPLAPGEAGSGTSVVEPGHDGFGRVVINEVPGTKARSVKEAHSVTAVGNKSSIQRRAVGGRNVETQAARLVRKEGEAIKLGDPSLFRFVLDISPSKDKQEDYVASRTVVKKRATQ